jgi:hypothetical protein
MHPRILRQINLPAAILLASAAIFLLSGCVVPGYPYYGYPQPGVVPQTVIPAYPYVYSPAPTLIAPSFYFGWGYGYWYGNRFWPYRNGCAFYGGRYYGGYGANYWRAGHGTWQGGHYGGGYGGGYRGGWGR